jgi:hypothetical protein
MARRLSPCLIERRQALKAAWAMPLSFAALFAGGPLRIAFAEKVPPVLDLSYAVALVLAGWSMSRLARQPG